MHSKVFFQAITALSTLLFGMASSATANSVIITSLFNSVIASSNATGSSDTSSGSTSSGGDVGCGKEVVINCDTHEIDDGNHKSKVDCGQATPSSYHGKVGETGKGLGTAWASMKGADIVRAVPDFCGNGCVFHTLPPSHDGQGGADPSGFNTTAAHTGCINPSPEVLKDLESDSCKGKSISLTFNSKGKETGTPGKGGSSTSVGDVFTPPENSEIAADSTGDDMMRTPRLALNMLGQAMMYVLSPPTWAAPPPTPTREVVWQIPFQLIGAHEMIGIDKYDAESDAFTVVIANDQHPNPLHVSAAALSFAIPNLKTAIVQGRLDQIVNSQFSTDTDLRVLFDFEMVNRRLALLKQRNSLGRAPASSNP